MRLGRYVPFHVQGKMIGSRECPFAESALERAVARVFAVVAGELVGAGELPSASLPGALVGFLARVGPQVGLQVRRFRVRLGASGERAQMSRHFLPAPSLPPCGISEHKFIFF